MALMNGQTPGTPALPAMAPLAVVQAGPVSGWPQHAESATAAAEEPAKSGIDGDAVIRSLTAIVVLAVAAFAAVVSYSHIFDLGIHHGQSGTAARLLPLSVDGLIAAASLVMLHAARNKLPVPLLSRLMLALGVGATVAANVAYGLPFGWLSAVVSAWPAAAFVGSVEMAIRFVSDARSVATSDAVDDGPDNGGVADKEPPPVTAGPLRQNHREPAAATVRTPPRQPSKPASKRTPGRPSSGRAKAAAVIKKDATLTDEEVAKRAGVSESTARRARTAIGAP
jgi:hypothetical protein